MKAPYQPGDRVLLDGSRPGTYLCQEDYAHSRFRLDDQDSRLAFVAQTARLVPASHAENGPSSGAASPGVRATTGGAP